MNKINNLTYRQIQVRLINFRKRGRVARSSIFPLNQKRDKLSKKLFKIVKSERKRKKFSKSDQQKTLRGNYNMVRYNKVHDNTSINKREFFNIISKKRKSLTGLGKIRPFIHLRFTYEDRSDKFTTIKMPENYGAFKIIVENMVESGNYGGSEVDVQFGTLDTTFFRIDYLKDVQKLKGGKRVKPIKSKYFITKNFDSKDNNCLLACVRYGKNDIRTKLSSYRDRILKHGIIKDEMIDIQDVYKIEKEFKINIDVYFEDDMMLKVDHLYKTKKKYKNSINVLLKEDHYQIITKEKTKRKSKSKPKKTIEPYKPLYLYYDLETKFNRKSCYYLSPYSVAWCVHNPESGDFNYFEQYKEEIKKLTEEGKTQEQIYETLDNKYKDNIHYKKSRFETKKPLQKLIDFILECPNGYKYIIIGYNSSRFDNFFLANCATKNNVIDTRSMLYVNNSILQMSIKQHKVFDLCRFLMASLKKSCESFNTCPKKINGFSHNLVQQQYDNGNLKNFLKENNDTIEKYNKYDVLSLMDLHLKVQKAVKTLTSGKDINDFLTIGHMGYEIFKKMNQYKIGTKYNKHKKQMEIIYKSYTPAPKDHETDKFIRKALTAGRTQCYYKKMDFKRRVRMVDVKSLYPFVMLNREYPIGNYINTEFYKKGKLGIYKCKIIHQNLKWVNKENIKFKYKKEDKQDEYDLSKKYAPTVFPLRSDKEGVSLNWEHRGKMNVNLTSVDIECIRKHGGKVNVVNGIYWEKTSKTIFNGFLEPFMHAKNNQDNIKNTIKKAKKENNVYDGEKYNNVLREMCKLFSNCLSGKVIQRNFEDVTAMISDTLSLSLFIEKVDEDTMIFEPHSKGIMFATGKKRQECIYKKDKAKPSYLGVFIYSYAREYMYETILSKYVTLYEDTDSACMPLEEYERFVKENHDLVNGKLKGKYGCLEEEVGNATRIITLQPKCYCVVNRTDKEKSKNKFKGVGKNDTYLTMNELKKIKNCSGEYFTFEKKVNKITGDICYKHNITSDDVEKQLIKEGRKTCTEDMFEQKFNGEKICVFQSQLRKELKGQINNSKGDKYAKKVINSDAFKQCNTLDRKRCFDYKKKPKGGFKIKQMYLVKIV
jgi:hypothetical protein